MPRHAKPIRATVMPRLPRRLDPTMGGPDPISTVLDPLPPHPDLLSPPSGALVDVGDSILVAPRWGSPSSLASPPPSRLSPLTCLWRALASSDGDEVEQGVGLWRHRRLGFRPKPPT